MTTSHRPTWNPAVGNKSSSGFRSMAVSGKDQTAHTKLKFRQVGQSSQSEILSRNLKGELERKEEEHLKSKQKAILMIEEEEKKVDVPRLLTNAPHIDNATLKKYDDSDVVADKNSEDDLSSRFFLSDIHNFYMIDLF